MAAGKTPSNLTERQQKWFASVKEGLEKETGKSFAEWVKIAKTCPEEKPAARKKWFKEVHGLGVNRASMILMEAFPKEGPGWQDPDGLIDALWKNADHRKIYDKLEKAIMKFEGASISSRKTYTAFSRKVQFAAARPYKGEVRLGLAVLSEADARFVDPLKSEGWSDRLKSSVMLTSVKDIDAKLVAALRQAWEAA